MSGRHGNFAAYRLAAALADRVHDQVVTWPKFEMWSLGIQLVRSADSIGANIAEGLGRGSRPDQRRFLLVARGSLYETEHWLDRAVARSMIGADEGFEAATAEVGRALSGLIRTTASTA